jgi:hypothetical protein
VEEVTHQLLGFHEVAVLQREDVDQLFDLVF